MRSLALIILLTGPGWGWAQALSGQFAPPPVWTDPPSFRQLILPDIPKFDGAGNTIAAKKPISLSQDSLLRDLSSRRARLLYLEQNEHEAGRLAWHQARAGAYCHFVDLEGNHWYGWLEGERFQWVYAYQGTLWGREPLDGRWLCFHRGNWWWRSRKDPVQLKVYRDGAYYSCDARGSVVNPQGERPGELRSEYRGPFRGDFMGRRGSFNKANAAGGAPRHGAQRHPDRPRGSRTGFPANASVQPVAWSGR